MKNVVFSDVGREVEFKPDSIYENYLKLTESDIKKEFRNKKNLSLSNCPACKSLKNTKAFVKFSLQYVECQNCGTVYVCPHPGDDQIKEHFLNSPSIHFWRDTLSKVTEHKRKEKIYGPRFDWIIDMADEYLSGAKNMGDFNSKDVGYIEELLRNNYFDTKTIVNPYFDINDIKAKNLKSNLSIVSDLETAFPNKNSINIATAFEVIDYTSNVEKLMNTIKNMLCKGGLCFITTISISGFDMQVLWENSRSIFPLDRINVLSQKGIKLLSKRHGFEMLEYSTPGILDLDIVEHELKNHPDLNIPRFVKTILERNDEKLNYDFQNFLQVNRLSSFVRIVLKKK